MASTFAPLRSICVLLVGAALLAACDRGDRQATSGPEVAAGKYLTGAGATFPELIYVRWANDYKATPSGVGLNYQPVGSVEGIRQIQAKAVDFGATDEPLKPEALDKAGLYQFPTLIGGVVPVVNLPGVEAGKLRLTGPVLADIYLGKIKSWDAPEIRALNPGLSLPHMPITVVHRAEPAGASFLLTTFLAGQSPAFASQVGASDTPKWPIGSAAKGNEGVAAAVKKTPGAIGYVVSAFASENALTWTSLRNRDGKFPPATAANFAAAAAGVDWAKAPGNYVMLVDQAGAEAWPISGATFVLVPRKPADPARTAKVLGFFDWAYRNGDGAAARSDYVPLPKEVKDHVRQQWATEVTGPDGKPVYVGKS